MSDHRRCSECGVGKPLSCFHKHNGMAAGFYAQCKMCMAQSHRNRRMEKKRPNAISGLLQKWGRNEAL